MGKFKLFKKLSIFCLAILTSGGVFSAEKSSSNEPTENLIVYGVRLQQPTTEIGSSVSILTADDIEALGSNFVLDVISTLPGVTINQNGAFGGAASVRIRGASSEQTLVIIDDVVVNDPTSPGGGFDFSRMDPWNIERIEVLKGPQSTLWGTDAMGGVINIVTKRPENEFNRRAFIQAGSFNTLRSGAELSAAMDHYDFRLAATSTSSDGISKADKINGNTEEDGYDANTVHAAAGTELWGNARLQANALWTNAKSDFDSYSFGAQGNVGDGDEYSKTEEVAANLKLLLPLLNGKLESIFLAGYSDIDRKSFNAGIQGFSSKGNRKILRYQGTLNINESSRLAFGAEQEKSKVNDDDITINGLFALYELQVLNSVTVSAGLRSDNHDRFEAVTTGRLAAAYNPNDQITLRASWDEGFKSPTLFQTTYFCCGATSPNSELKPETSEAFDIGITFRTADKRGGIELTYFNQDTTNLINFSYGIGGYENIAAASSSGIEVGSNYSFMSWLNAAISYTYINAKDGTGTPLIRVPKHSGDLIFSFNPKGRLNGSLHIKHNGEEQDPNGVIDSWSRVDITSRFAISDSVKIYAQIENLFDKQYQQIIGYGTPGISGHLGVHLRF